MKTEEKRGKLRLKAIANGTTIDHIPQGKALHLLEALDIKTENPIGVIMNAPSTRMGKKDLIFVEGLELTKKHFAIIGLIARNATINIIRESNVVHKDKARLPKNAEGIIKCINPNCITNQEDIETKFKIQDKPIQAKCFYCERRMSEKEILKRIK